MNLNLGFSYVGFIFICLLIIPNLFWSKNKSKDYEKYVNNENKIYVFLERSGEVIVTCLSLNFTDFNINNISFMDLDSFCSIFIYSYDFIRNWIY